MNNTKYFELFDTAINEYLINAGVLDIHSKVDPIGFCIESKCTYNKPVAYPSVLKVGVRCGHIGNSSVRWECAVYDEGVVAAEGYFVHVFVKDGVKVPIGGPLRASIADLMIDEEYNARIDMFGVASKGDVRKFASQGCVWLDVRSSMEVMEDPIACEYVHCHVTMDDLSKLEKDFASLLPDKDKPVLAFCGVGGRVVKAKEFLEAQGYTVLNGGGLKDVRELAR